MIKILHTADWQIGLRASHVARVGETVRRARMNAARGVVERANSERVDALVLAGDIFEDNHVDNALVFEIVRILSGAQVPVFVLPGNHDPLSQDSVYRRASWKERSPNIRLLENNAPVEIAGGRALLLPAPLSLKKSVLDPTEDLKLPENGAQGVLIGVAHGSLKIEGKYQKDDFPIALDAAQRRSLSYLALGHWHGRYVHGDRTAYSGTLETTKFGEDNSGMSLLVELDESRAAPRVSDLPTGQLRWISRELDLNQSPEHEIARLRQEIAADSQSRERVLLRVRTVGESSADSHLLIKNLQDEFATNVLHFELDRKDVSSAVVQGRMAALASRHPFIASLLESLGRAAEDSDLQGLGPAEIDAARKLLTELIGESV